MSNKFNSKDRITQIKEWKKNQDGSLTIPVVIISEEVLDYPEFGTQEYVSDDIYKDEFLNQINGLPFVLEHPIVNGVPIDVKSDNYSQFIKGSCFEPEAQPDKKRVVANCRVYDKDVVNAIESGDIKELSAKYESADVKEDGTFDGKQYNVRQTNMVLNHLALTEAGRAGDKVKVLISKQNSRGDKMEDEKKPDEEKVNQDIEETSSDESAGGLTLEAVAQQVKDLTEIVQGLVDKTPSEPEKANEDTEMSEEEKKKSEMMNMVKENSISKTDIEALMAERDQTISDAKELIGNDAVLMLNKLNSLDALRRYALVKSKRYDENSVKGLSAEGAIIALKEAAYGQSKINSMIEAGESQSQSYEDNVSFFADAENYERSA